MLVSLIFFFLICYSFHCEGKRGVTWDCTRSDNIYPSLEYFFYVLLACRNKRIETSPAFAFVCLLCNIFLVFLPCNTWYGLVDKVWHTLLYK